MPTDAGVEPGPGWRVAHMTSPRGLSGSNGVRIGPDGGVYVVSAFGSEIARVDPDSGELAIVSPKGDGIVSPDDLAFDSAGTMFVTECMDARVSVREPDGSVRVLADGIRGANGIDVFEDRIFVDEFLPSGRMLEVFRDGRAPRVLAEDLIGANGMSVGPDRHIYAVQVFTGDVIRLPIDGDGPVETFLSGLAAPSSVRFRSDGLMYVSLGGSGEVLTADIRTGETTTLVRTRAGIDNLDVDPAGRVFISYYIDGAVMEALGDDAVRELVPPGLMVPYGLAVVDGDLHVADGFGTARVRGDGPVERLGKITDEGFPGYVRGLGTQDGRCFWTTTDGAVSTFDPIGRTGERLVDGLADPAGVDVLADGTLVVAETAAGRVTAIAAGGSTTVLAEGLGRPVGIAVAAGDAVFVTDQDRGQVLRVAGGAAEVVLDGLDAPQGIAVSGGELFVLEAGSGRVLCAPAGGGEPSVVATGVPVVATSPETLNGLPDMIPGPMHPFADVAADESRVYVGGDATGVVIVLERGA